MVAAIVLAVVVMAACGGGGGATKAAAVPEAPDRTVAAGTAHFTVAATVAAAGRTVSQGGQGSVDFTGRKVDTTATVAGTGGNAAAGRQIVIGDDVWLSAPGSLTGGAGSKPFVHSTREAESADIATSLSRPADPLELLADLRGVDPASVKRLGTARLHGAGTTHFGATVDLLATAGADPAAAATGRAIASVTGSSRVPVEVWIDGAGRVRRLQLNLRGVRLSAGGADPSGSGGGTGLSLDVTLTTDLFDFGTPVTIAPPPPDQVMEASELQGP